MSTPTATNDLLRAEKFNNLEKKVTFVSYLVLEPKKNAEIIDGTESYLGIKCHTFLGSIESKGIGLLSERKGNY